MDLDIIRTNFKSYMKSRYPDNKYISSDISMAFYLAEHGKEVGVDFQKILSERSIPASCKQKLEKHFEKKGRKNPSSNAFTYLRNLKLLIEFLEGKPLISSEVKVNKKKVISSSKKKSLVEIPTPTKAAVKKYLADWQKLSDYREQEEALYILFHDTYKLNTKINEVLIKCSVLNDFYSTGILKIYPMAKHIINLNIDNRLSNGDPVLVNDISRGHGIVSRANTEIHFFSFASKYCSHHNPLDFPIFDSYVVKLLKYFRDKDNFAYFSNEDMRDFPKFKKTILDFRKSYNLEEFSLKQLDQYLWQFGKDVFPKSFY